jgi:hypothetical protein
VLKLDARNRAARTLLQTVVAGALVAAGDAAWQVLQAALATAAAGGSVDWGHVAGSAGIAAAMAAVTPMVAWAHRRWLDPSRVPSLPPPA